MSTALDIRVSASDRNHAAATEPSYIPLDIMASARRRNAVGIVSAMVGLSLVRDAGSIEIVDPYRDTRNASVLREHLPGMFSLIDGRVFWLEREIDEEDQVDAADAEYAYAIERFNAGKYDYPGAYSIPTEEYLAKKAVYEAWREELIRLQKDRDDFKRANPIRPHWSMQHRATVPPDARTEEENKHFADVAKNKAEYAKRGEDIEAHIKQEPQFDSERPQAPKHRYMNRVYYLNFADRQMKYVRKDDKTSELVRRTTLLRSLSPIRSDQAKVNVLKQFGPVPITISNKIKTGVGRRLGKESSLLTAYREFAAYSAGSVTAAGSDVLTQEDPPLYKGEVLAYYSGIKKTWKRLWGKAASGDETAEAQLREWITKEIVWQEKREQAVDAYRTQIIEAIKNREYDGRFKIIPRVSGQKDPTQDPAIGAIKAGYGILFDDRVNGLRKQKYEHLLLPVWRLSKIAHFNEFAERNCRVFDAHWKGENPDKADVAFVKAENGDQTPKVGGPWALMGYESLALQRAAITMGSEYETLTEKVEQKRAARRTVSPGDCPVVPHLSDTISEGGFMPHQGFALAALQHMPDAAILDLSMGAGKTLIMMSDAVNSIKEGNCTRPCLLMPSNTIPQQVEEYTTFLCQGLNVLAITSQSWNKYKEMGIPKARRGQAATREKGSNDRAKRNVKEAIRSAPPNTLILVSYSWLTNEKIEIETGDLTQKRVGHEQKQKTMRDYPRGRWLVDECGIDYVCLDESHLAKNNRSATTIAVSGMSHAKVKRIASGTITPSKPDDAFAQLSFLDPTLMGRKLVRNQRYSVSNDNEYGTFDRFSERAIKVLRSDMEEFGMLSMRRTEWMHMLPERVENRYTVTLPKVLQDFYDQALEAILTSLDELTSPEINGAPNPKYNEKVAKAFKKWKESENAVDEEDGLTTKYLLPHLIALDQFVGCPGAPIGGAYEERKQNKTTGEIEIIDRREKIPQGFIVVRETIERMPPEEKISPKVKKCAEIIDAHFRDPRNKATNPETDEEVWGKVIIFSKNVHVAKHVFEWLPTFCSEVNQDEIVLFHGQYKKDLERFKKDPNIRVMVAADGSLKVGHNLQMANRAIRVDVHFTPGDTEQVFGRVFRPRSIFSNVWIDTILTRKTHEISKYGRLMGKYAAMRLLNSEFISGEFDDVPAIFMTEDTMRDLQELDQIAPQIAEYTAAAEYDKVAAVEAKIRLGSDMITDRGGTQLPEADVIYGYLPYYDSDNLTLLPRPIEVKLFPTVTKGRNKGSGYALINDEVSVASIDQSEIDADALRLEKMISGGSTIYRSKRLPRDLSKWVAKAFSRGFTEVTLTIMTSKGKPLASRKFFGDGSYQDQPLVGRAIERGQNEKLISMPGEDSNARPLPQPTQDNKPARSTEGTPAEGDTSGQTGMTEAEGREPLTRPPSASVSDANQVPDAPDFPIPDVPLREDGERDETDTPTSGTGVRRPGGKGPTGRRTQSGGGGARPSRRANLPRARTLDEYLRAWPVVQCGPQWELVLVHPGLTNPQSSWYAVYRSRVTKDGEVASVKYALYYTEDRESISKPVKKGRGMPNRTKIKGGTSAKPPINAPLPDKVLNRLQAAMRDHDETLERTAGVILGSFSSGWLLPGSFSTNVKAPEYDTGQDILGLVDRVEEPATPAAAPATTVSDTPTPTPTPAVTDTGTNVTTPSQPEATETEDAPVSAPAPERPAPRPVSPVDAPVETQRPERPTPAAPADEGIPEREDGTPDEATETEGPSNVSVSIIGGKYRAPTKDEAKVLRQAIRAAVGPRTVKVRWINNGSAKGTIGLHTDPRNPPGPDVAIKVIDLLESMGYQNAGITQSPYHNLTNRRRLSVLFDHPLRNLSVIKVVEAGRIEGETPPQTAPVADQTEVDDKTDNSTPTPSHSGDGAPGEYTEDVTEPEVVGDRIIDELGLLEFDGEVYAFVDSDEDDAEDLRKYGMTWFNAYYERSFRTFAELVRVLTQIERKKIKIENKAEFLIRARRGLSGKRRRNRANMQAQLKEMRRRRQSLKSGAVSAHYMKTGGQHWLAINILESRKDIARVKAIPGFTDVHAAYWMPINSRADLDNLVKNLRKGNYQVRTWEAFMQDCHELFSYLPAFDLSIRSTGPVAPPVIQQTKPERDREEPVIIDDEGNEPSVEVTEPDTSDNRNVDRLELAVDAVRDHGKYDEAMNMMENMSDAVVSEVARRVDAPSADRDGLDEFIGEMYDEWDAERRRDTDVDVGPAPVHTHDTPVDPSPAPTPAVAEPRGLEERAVKLLAGMGGGYSIRGVGLRERLDINRRGRPPGAITNSSYISRRKGTGGVSYFLTEAGIAFARSKGWLKAPAVSPPLNVPTHMTDDQWTTKAMADFGLPPIPKKEAVHPSMHHFIRRLHYTYKILAGGEGK